MLVVSPAEYNLSETKHTYSQTPT